MTYRPQKKAFIFAPTKENKLYNDVLKNGKTQPHAKLREKNLLQHGEKGTKKNYDFLHLLTYQLFFNLH